MEKISLTFLYIEPSQNIVFFVFVFFFLTPIQTLYFYILVSGQLQLRKLFLRPEGIRLLELPLHIYIQESRKLLVR